MKKVLQCTYNFYEEPAQKGWTCSTASYLASQSAAEEVYEKWKWKHVGMLYKPWFACTGILGVFMPKLAIFICKLLAVYLLIICNHNEPKNDLAIFG